MKEDLLGRKFGRLTVIGMERLKRSISWRCRCECGNQGFWKRKTLTSGNTKSCGCLKVERIASLNKSHGLAGTRFYWVFHGMKARCYNKNHNRYDLYGAKGIRIEWNSFDEFAADMHESYLQHCKDYGQENTYIERRNNDKNYSKENCYWSTALEQGNNTSRNHKITIDGKTLNLSQWCREYGLTSKYHSIKDRIYSGWEPKDAFTIPFVNYQKVYTTRHGDKKRRG